MPEAFAGARDDGLRALVEALGQLGASDPEGSKIVAYQHFAGLAQAEAAEVPGGYEKGCCAHRELFRAP